MKMQSLSVVGLCLLLMVGMSWELGADDHWPPCHCLNSCGVPFIKEWCGPNCESADVKVTCEETCETQLSKKPKWYRKDNKTLTKEDFTRIVEKRSIESKERIKRLEKGFGYKDIKLGMLPIDIETLGICSNWFGGSCYNKTGWLFDFSYGHKNGCNSGLNTIFIDLGPYSSDFHQELFETLGKKYTMNYGLTDRDIERYNSRDLDSLNVVYKSGAVGLRIYPKDDNHRIGIVYYDEDQATIYLEKYQPQKAGDF